MLKLFQKQNVFQKENLNKKKIVQQNIISDEGGGGLFIFIFFLTRGEGGCRPLSYFCSQGGRGGLQTQNFVWHHM